MFKFWKYKFIFYLFIHHIFNLIYSFPFISWFLFLMSMYKPIRVDISFVFFLEFFKIIIICKYINIKITWSVSIRVTFWIIKFPHFISINCTLFSPLNLLVDITSLNLNDRMVSYLFIFRILHFIEEFLLNLKNFTCVFLSKK